MPWLTLLHIMAVASWCGVLLYLPAMVAANSGGPGHLSEELSGHAFARYLFTLAATPAALIAITSGTVLFVRDANIAGWLLLKLLIVTVLVICHMLCGFLVLRAERRPEQSHGAASLALGGATATSIMLVLWLVLTRPG